MCALLDHIALIHDQNHVGCLNGRQAVCYDEAGAPGHQLFKRALDMLLGTGVDRGGGLVQNQHGRQAEHHARDAQELFLPLA